MLLLFCGLPPIFNFYLIAVIKMAFQLLSVGMCKLGRKDGVKC